MSATVRFSQIVDASGKPQLHILWGSPAADAAFQRALKGKRIMTIRQDNVGSKKDFGLVGFSQESPAQFLIFPRSLKAFEGKRVVGINYESFELPPQPASHNRANDRGKKEKLQPAVATKRKSPPAPLAPTQPQPLQQIQPTLAPAKSSAPRDPTPNAEERVASPPTRPKKKSSLNPSTPAPDKRGSQPGLKLKEERTGVLKEVRTAMKDLEAGKAVLVFRRLEKLADYLSHQK